MLWTTNQDPSYCYIVKIFRKTTKASSIETCGLLPDFRLKNCGEEVFFRQATLAINVSKLLIPSEISNRTAKELQ